MGVKVGYFRSETTELWPLMYVCFALRFRVLNLVPFDLSLQTLHRHWYQRGVVWDCKWDNFIQKQQSYSP